MTEDSDIHALTREGDSWRIVVAGVFDSYHLSEAMFPHGVDNGPLITDQASVERPEVMGEFLIADLSGAALHQMAPVFADRFRAAGLQDTSSAPQGDEPYEGYVRTWPSDGADAVDLMWQDALRIHVDNWSDATVQHIADQPEQTTVTFHYEDGTTYPLRLDQIETDQRPATYLRNIDTHLVVPTEETWVPVLNLRTCPRMAYLRIEFQNSQARREQMELGPEYLVAEFTRILEILRPTRFTNPDDAFPDGLGRV